MRITIKFDSADTTSVRKLAVALHHVGLTAQLQVGVNGPDAWCGETPALKPWQWAQVACRLINFEDKSVSDTLETLRRERDEQRALVELLSHGHRAGDGS